MTRKDYIQIAGLFATTCPKDQTWYTLRTGLAEILAQDNPRFDRERFVAATEAYSDAPDGAGEIEDATHVK